VFWGGFGDGVWGLGFGRDCWPAAGRAEILVDKTR
jgi:hypothetical protein